MSNTRSTTRQVEIYDDALSSKSKVARAKRTWVARSTCVGGPSVSCGTRDDTAATVSPGFEAVVQLGSAWLMPSVPTPWGVWPLVSSWTKGH